MDVTSFSYLQNCLKRLLCSRGIKEYLQPGLYPQQPQSRKEQSYYFIDRFKNLLLGFYIRSPRLYKYWILNTSMAYGGGRRQESWEST